MFNCKITYSIRIASEPQSQLFQKPFINWAQLFESIKKQLMWDTHNNDTKNYLLEAKFPN